MLRFRRYIAGDAALVSYRQPLAREAEGLEGLLAGALPPGPAWTLSSDGLVMGCGGLAPVWPGRVIAWTYIGNLDRRGWMKVARMCRVAIASAFDGGLAGDDVVRVEAHTPADFPPGARLLEWLGFECEGLARRWGPDGSDYVAYARVKS